MGVVHFVSPEGHPAVCDESRADYYRELGWTEGGLESAVDAGDTPEGAEIAEDDSESEDEIADEPPKYSERQKLINKAVADILTENEADNFTSTGLPKVEIIANYARVQQVSGTEREVAMSAFQPE